MNKKNLLKLISFIEKAPAEKFNMDTWFEHSEEKEEDLIEDVVDYLNDHKIISNKKYFNHCNTAGCIAGHCVIMGSIENKGSYERDISVSDYAKDYLGLSSREAYHLFTPNLIVDEEGSYQVVTKKDALEVLRLMYHADFSPREAFLFVIAKNHKKETKEGFKALSENWEHDEEYAKQFLD